MSNLRITLDVLESEAVLTAEEKYCGYVTRETRIIPRTEIRAAIDALLTGSDYHEKPTCHAPQKEDQDWLNKTCPA